MRIVSANITGSLILNNVDVTDYLVSSSNISSSVNSKLNSLQSSTSSLNSFTSSYSTGSFTGSFKGDGTNLYNIPATGVTGLQLDKIASGAVTASVSANGFNVNSNVSITGSIVASGTSLVSGSSQINITGTTEYSTFSSSISTSIGSLSSSVASTTNTLSSSVSSSIGSLSSSVATTTSGLSSSLSSSIGSLSSSVATTTVGTKNRVDSIEAKTGSYATTGSNTFIGTENITGNLTVTGSVIISSGSAVYNSSLNLTDTSSLTLNSGSNLYVYDSGIISGTFKGSVTGSLGINGNVSITGSIVASGTSLVSGSSQIDITSTTNYTTFSSSISSSIGNLSSSVATNTSGLSGRITTIEGRYATTGSNVFVGSQVITGSLYITTDLVVQGSSSLQNITASAVSIGTNTVILNTDTPAVRFAGVSVQDSGSNVGVTGSIYWDGLCNRWVYSNPSNVGYSGGLLISGPRNVGTLGDEAGTTSCALMMGQGGDHITSSAIFHYGNSTCFYGNTVVSSSGSVCTTMANANCIGINTTTPFKRLTIDASDVASDGIAVRGNSSPAYILCETSGVGSTFTNDSVAGYIGTITNHPFNVRSNSQDRLTFSSGGIACFACQVCTPTLVAGTGGIRSSNNIIFPSNLTTFTIWNEGYGGAIQLRRSDATTDRYARIGIVNDTGVWVSGMSIDGATAFGKFDAGICTAGGACLAKVFVNSVTDDAASALQIKVLAANATSARIASTTNNNLFSFISNGVQGHAIMDMGRCTESGTFGAGYIRLRVDGNSWIQGGCVGINTGSPDQSLTVNQGATTTGQGIPATSSTTQNGILRLRPAVGVYGETLDFGMNVTPTYGWIQSTNASDLSTNYALRLNPNGGSVTVGTSCAAFGRKLTVQSDVVAYYSDTENITMGISAGTGAQSWGIQVCDTGDGNSTLHLNARGGYVGINKGSGNAAAYSLDVTGTIKASSSIISDSSLIACAFQGAGFSTLTAGAGTGTAVFDTITRSGNGLYEVALIANANAGGASYNDFYYGRLLIGTGYQFPNVVDYLVWCQESVQPRTLYGSGGGNLTINVCMYQSSVESSCIGTNGAYTIRFKISGYNSGYTGAGTTIYLKRII